jgi:hypothetical protein
LKNPLTLMLLGGVGWGAGLVVILAHQGVIQPRGSDGRMNDYMLTAQRKPNPELPPRGLRT